MIPVGELLQAAASVQCVLVVLCALTVNPATLLCRQLEGTLYSDHSGPSGHGVGTLELSTQNSLIPVHYQKPIRNDFSKIDAQYLQNNGKRVKLEG